MAYVNFYYELDVYKLSRQLAKDVYRISKNFPKEEKFSLTDQIRRSSRSVGAQIAESWAKRRYINHFIAKLTDSDAEQYETQHWIEVAFDCELVNDQERELIVKSCEVINQKLNAMMSKASLFCTIGDK
ncbi:four helix bundle protein [Algoriphagus ratkowskyi]|uniref:Four helix bundle protein n=1 Tax=Algoriphagus ratkowskyi TaxID=57028 RepID=A0A2W7R662_9BACT|nr:four helix bundle protein [Algoriphagus ratkowskyi]PZX55954.1 four helix bundle protein [Algoriphagus ratkowskyi]TXD77233.1 four helix bundle protein [Algoriphagus ratkowskyi]